MRVLLIASVFVSCFVTAGPAAAILFDLVPRNQSCQLPELVIDEPGWLEWRVDVDEESFYIEWSDDGIFRYYGEALYRYQQTSMLVMGLDEDGHKVPYQIVSCDAYLSHHIFEHQTSEQGICSVWSIEPITPEMLDYVTSVYLIGIETGVPSNLDYWHDDGDAWSHDELGGIGYTGSAVVESWFFAFESSELYLAYFQTPRYLRTDKDSSEAWYESLRLVGLYESKPVFIGSRFGQSVVIRNFREDSHVYDNDVCFSSGECLLNDGEDEYVFTPHGEIYHVVE